MNKKNAFIAAVVIRRNMVSEMGNSDTNVSHVIIFLQAGKSILINYGKNIQKGNKPINN